MNLLEVYLTQVTLFKLSLLALSLYSIYLAIFKEKLRYALAFAVIAVICSPIINEATLKLNQKKLELQEGKPVLLNIPSGIHYGSSQEVILQKENGKITHKTPGQILLEQQEKTKVANYE